MSKKMSPESIEVLRKYTHDLKGIMDILEKAKGEKIYDVKECKGENVKAYSALLQAFNLYVGSHQSPEDREKIQDAMWQYVCAQNPKK